LALAVDYQILTSLASGVLVVSPLFCSFPYVTVLLCS
jgi:hypothetical protein